MPLSSLFSRLSLYLCLLTLLPAISRADDIAVAVASNFITPMKAIANVFEQRFPHRLRLASGSSGKFYAQIKRGAPFEVFFSADQAKPQALEKDGLTVPDSRFTYAVGTLVLWSKKTDFVDNNATRLTNGQFRKLALANPRLAPYGAAAVDVLKNLGVADRTRHKWVQGENIAQAYQFTVSGNAELGFVALSQVMNDGKLKQGSAWIVPATLHRPIRQDGVLLRRGQDSQGARDLMAFMRSDAAKRIILDHGYQSRPAN